MRVIICTSQSTIILSLCDLFFHFTIFQVVTGGQYDVDMTLQDKGGKILYKGVKKQYDSFSWKTETEGTYKVLFHSLNCLEL